MAMIKCPECGTDVSDTAAACPKCGYGVKQHIENEIRAAQEAERREIRKARAEERNKKLKVIIPIVSVIAVVAIIVSGYCYTMSQRMTFKTEDEMREYLKGDWEEETSYREGDKLCRIKDDVLERIDTDMGSRNSAGPIEYFPEKGYIKVTDENSPTKNIEKYIVKKDGTLEAHQHGFKKSIGNKHDDISAFVDAIKFYEGTAELSDDGILTIKGKAVNQGNREYRLLRAKVNVMNGEDIVKSSIEYVQLSNGNYSIRAGSSLEYTIQDGVGKTEITEIRLTPVGYQGADDK